MFWSNVTKQWKEVRYADPMWCRLTNQRVRFVRIVDSGAVEVMDNDGCNILPDYRHPTQLNAY